MSKRTKCKSKVNKNYGKQKRKVNKNYCRGDPLVVSKRTKCKSKVK